MTESFVPDKLTPVTPTDLHASFVLSWPAIVQDVAITRPALLVMLAHWALETGFGHYCHCWNLGNAKHRPGDGHNYTAFRHNEIQAGGKVVWLDDPPRSPPQDPFIAFASLNEGAIYYLTQLRARWRSAWPFVLAGDPDGFCHALKSAGYYTDDETHYTWLLKSCMHSLDQMIPADVASDAARAALAEIQFERGFAPDPVTPPDELA